MKGHVRKRGNTWTAVVFIGFGDDGKRKYKWYGGFRKEKDAQKFLRDKIGEIEDGIYNEPTKDTVGAYLTDWLAVKKQQVRMNTWLNHEARVRNHIAPALGHIQLINLQPKHIQDFYTTLSDTLSTQTILHIHRLLHDALGRAVKWRLIQFNPADAVDPPKVQRMQFSVWDAEQIGDFLDAAESNRWYIVFLLAITTGMRQGEILGLKWEDIDFEKKRLRVNRSLSFASNELEVQEPKTKRSRREITLPDEMVQALRKHRSTQLQERLAKGEKYIDNGYVVTNKDGTTPRPTSIRRAYANVVKQAGVPYIRFHDLRHTHASLMLEQGIHAKVISERLGHSTIGTTMDIYTHVLPSIQEAAAAQIGDAIFGKKKGDKEAE